MTIQVKTVVPVLDTSQYADGDTLFNPTEITNFFIGAADGAILTSIEVIDADDQGVAMDLIFFSSGVTLGTLNSAPNISDANAALAVSRPISIATGDYIDWGGSRIGGLDNIGRALYTGSTSLWVGGITRGGTPTYTASGLTLKFGVWQQ